MNAMYKIMAIVSSVVFPSVANASTIAWQTSNQTGSTVVNTSYKVCNNSQALLPAIPANSTSSPTTIGCGVSSLVSFDYEGNGKKCQYTIAVFFNNNQYMPTGSAKSSGSVPATCKIINLGAAAFGSYNFAVTMQ